MVVYHQGSLCKHSLDRHSIMDNVKSQEDVELKHYVSLLTACYRDVASAPAYPEPELMRDIQEIEHRAYHEGLSFLTKTLPSLAKAVDRALATGQVLQFSRFKKARGTELPRFAWTLFSLVFDGTGRERSDASPWALWSIRNLFYAYYKLELPINEKQKNEVIQLFIRTDNELTTVSYEPSRLPENRFDSHKHMLDLIEADRSSEPGPDPQPQGCGTDLGSYPTRESYSCTPPSGLCTCIDSRRYSTFKVLFKGFYGRADALYQLAEKQEDNRTRRDQGPEPDPCIAARGSILVRARQLIARVLSPVSPTEGLRPRHGPGAVATGEKGAEKMQFKRFYTDLASVFPYDEHFYYNLTHLSDDLQGLMSLETLASGTAKVVLVPKDSRGPRLISCEPLEYQWIQQGLMKILVERIQSFPLTSGFVNFTDQEINRQLALAGSKSKDLVTLDMKEASDRVSLVLVKDLVPKTWYDALHACRSSATKLPDGTVFNLKKFAPMGSAVCFPVEALIFWALSVASIEYTYGRRNAPVYVYGDDIIVRAQDHRAVMQCLPLFGLMLNADKCCTHGSFKESCGLDAYKGVDVTPTRVRSRWISSLPGTSYPSWVALANALLEKGFWSAADYLIEAIQKIRCTPYVSKGCGAIGFVDPRKIDRHENRRLKVRTRWNAKLHRQEIWAWKVSPRVLKDTRLPGWSEMLRLATSKTMETKHPIVRLAPANVVEDWKVNPSKFTPTIVVKAYQYTLPRQVTLKRGWIEVQPQ